MSLKNGNEPSRRRHFSEIWSEGVVDDLHLTRMNGQFAAEAHFLNSLTLLSQTGIVGQVGIDGVDCL